MEHSEDEAILIARIDFLIEKASLLHKLVKKMDANSNPLYKQLADFTSDVLAFEENPDLKLEQDMLAEVLPTLEERYKNLPEQYK